MKLVRIGVIALVALFAVSAAFAQTGGLRVRVVDSNGPLPGAIVTISHETGYVKTTSLQTDVDGVAVFPVLRPGKGYAIEVSFPGFGTRRVSDLQVRIGDTVDLPIQLAEELTERVKITANADVIDLSDNSTTNTFSDEFVQDLPVPGRFYQNVLTLAPGVQDSDGDGNPNVHGSRERDFKAVVGGVSNVDPLTGGWASRVNPNSIEEMEVITAGAGVEFSRAQGGFARIIQKQGSNEFEGVFEFFYRSSKLDGDGAGDFSNLPDQQFDWFQPSVQVSGPVIKDKLWYRLSHEIIDQELPVNVSNGLAVTTVEQGIHADQLTWQVSPRNKLAFQFQSDPLDARNVGVDSLTPPESAWRVKRGGETYSLKWTSPVSPKILVDTTVAWQDLSTGQFPATAGIQNDCIASGTFGFLSDAQCTDADSGQTSGSYFLSTDDARQRLTVASQADVFGGRIWGVNHQFKLGMSVENERYFRDLTRLPNLTVFVYNPLNDGQDDDDTPEEQAIVSARLAVPQTIDSTAKGITWGLYAQDEIQIRSNLTMTVGARVDREEISSNGRSIFDPEAESNDLLDQLDSGISIQQAQQSAFTAYEDLDSFVTQLSQALGLPRDQVEQRLSNTTRNSTFWATERRAENIELSNTNFSPFLSIAWDPWSNNKTKFAVTGRRYYDKLFLNVPLLELNPVTTDLVFNAERDVEGRFRVTGLRESVNPAVNINAVSRDLKTPYQDEFTFQFERELWTETSLRFTYINRQFQDQLQDIDTNHVPLDVGRCTIATLLDPTTVVPSPGMGQTLIDPYTGIEYIDTDPGPGDGYIAPGFSRPFDDCAGEIIVPEGQDTTAGDPFSREARLEEPDGRPDLYLQNPGWGDIYLLGNFNSIDYEGYVLEIIRRQYRSWEMQGSYTFSKAIGDGEDFAQNLGDDRSLLEDEKGYQSYDQRHVVKVNATTITPWGFRLGGAVTWQSGLPYSLLERTLSFDQVVPEYGTLGSGNAARVRSLYTTGSRNDQRNSSYWNFDVKFTKEMNLGRGLNMQVSAEVFNLLNDGTYIVYNQFQRAGFQVNGNNGAVRRFGRQWQVGMKIAF